MTSRFTYFLASLCVLTLVANSYAAPFLGSGDSIIAIDTDAPILPSNYPGAEAPIKALDATSGTKYLNFAKVNSGFIVKPFIGATTVQSIKLTTANDAPARDPLSWELYGTNDALTSVDNGDGSAENWTLISSNTANLPEARLTDGPIQSFANTTSYSMYRVLFPTVKDVAAANSMQIADVGLYESNNGSGLSVWDGFETDVRAFAYAQPDSRYPGGENPSLILDGNGPNPSLPSQSGYFAGEGPANVVDGTAAKYLNFGDADSGFIVTPASGASQVRSFRLTTANDGVDRDPTSWALYGTNDAITSADNSYGTAENWTLVDQGAITLPTARDTLGDLVTVDSTASFSSYKMLFPTLVGFETGPADLMQIGEASFYSTVDGSGADILNAGDPTVAIDGTPRFGSETKYLNFGGQNSGFIVTPEAGSKVITGFQITTANDFETRDPSSYEIYGTNDAVTSADNSQGTAENWTLISSGALSLPVERLTEDELVEFVNSTAFTSYKVVFPTIKDPGVNNDNAMQIATIQFFDASTATPGDFDSDGDVDGRDFLVWQRGGSPTPRSATDLAAWQNNYGAGSLAAVGSVPEPMSGVLIAFGLAAGCLVRGRR